MARRKLGTRRGRGRGRSSNHSQAPVNVNVNVNAIQQPSQVSTTDHSSSFTLPRKIRIETSMVSPPQVIANRRASLRSTARKCLEIRSASPVASRNQESEDESSSSSRPNAEIDNFLHSDLPPSVPTPVTSNSTVVGSSLSLHLSEMANMWQDNASTEPEVGFLSSSLVTVNGYRVKEAYASILRAIIGKHGDIGMSCTLARVETRSCLLEIVCGIIQTLQDKNFKEITQEEISSLLGLVTDLRDVKLDVDWLYRKLDDILEAKKRVRDCYTLKEAKSRQIQVIEEAERELEGYNAEKLIFDQKISLTEEKLKSAKSEIDIIDKIGREAKPKAMAYLEGSMVDGLL